MSAGNGKSRVVGPYGTNVGDTWLGTDSELGQMLMERDGLTLVFEVIQGDGGPEERFYCTKDPELIAEATAGHELWVAARAAMN